MSPETENYAERQARFSGKAAGKTTASRIVARLPKSLVMLVPIQSRKPESALIHYPFLEKIGLAVTAD